MRFFLVLLGFIGIAAVSYTPPVWASDESEDAASFDDTQDDSDDATKNDGDDASFDDNDDDASLEDDASGSKDSDDAAKDEDTSEDDAATDDASEDEDSKEAPSKKDEKNASTSSKKSNAKQSDQKKKANTSTDASSKASTMPFAKKIAICPRGLDTKDIREVFQGFSYDGFQKVSTEGEHDLNNGLMRKPWGFYKGLDKRQYAVYAFKPDPKNVVSLIDTDKLSAFQMTRIKIPEYCALYTEISPDEAASDKHEPVGLLISRASLYKPRPVDPGAAKANAVQRLIKSGVEARDIAEEADTKKSSLKEDKKDTKKDEKKDAKKSENDEENILGRAKTDDKNSLVDTSEAKIFEKLSAKGDEDADDSTSDAEEQEEDDMNNEQDDDAAAVDDDATDNTDDTSDDDNNAFDDEDNDQESDADDQGDDEDEDV